MSSTKKISWRCQNPDGRLYTHYQGGTNTYSRINRVLRSIGLRIDVEIDNEINYFSNQITLTLLVKGNRFSLKKEKGIGF